MKNSQKLVGKQSKKIIAAISRRDWLIAGFENPPMPGQGV
jgi:hypothetical protein